MDLRLYNSRFCDMDDEHTLVRQGVLTERGYDVFAWLNSGDKVHIGPIMTSKLSLILREVDKKYRDNIKAIGVSPVRGINSDDQNLILNHGIGAH
jgi:hypothetical protein